MYESDVEKKICKLARDNGWITYKFSACNEKGVPDRIFIKEGRIIWTEIKRADGIVSRMQEYQLARMNNMGCEVFVWRSVEEAKEVLCD